VSYNVNLKSRREKSARSDLGFSKSARRPLSQLDAAVRSLPKAVAELDTIDTSIAELFGEVSGVRFSKSNPFTEETVIVLAFASSLRTPLLESQEELIATQSRFSKMIADALTAFPIGESRRIQMA